MATHTVILTILTPAFADTIFACLIGRGWKVSPIPGSNAKEFYDYVTTEENILGALLTFRLEPAGQSLESTHTISKANKDLEEILKENSISFFSLVVLKANMGTCWSLGNIKTATPERLTAWQQLDSKEIQ